jgi:hypothetical protein
MPPPRADAAQLIAAALDDGAGAALVLDPQLRIR